MSHSVPLLYLLIKSKHFKYIFQKDVDFQSDIGYIAGHWKGFDDIHSGIEYYNVGLGSRPYTSDVMAMVDVGLRTGTNALTLWFY